MKKICAYLLLIGFFTTNCGFKPINKVNNRNFDIIEIVTTGESRINYKLKRKLLFNKTESSKKLFKIDLNSKKDKIVKEKNIKNEVTKYEIRISVQIKINEIGRQNIEKFTVESKGQFLVKNLYTQTINNEKRLVDLLTDKVADKIFNEISNRVNDI